MTEEMARSILRLLGVITVLVGAILTTTTLVSLWGVKSAIANVTQGLQIEATGMVAEMGWYAVFAHVLILGWGFALYAASEGLARRIVQ